MLMHGFFTFEKAIKVQITSLQTIMIAIYKNKTSRCDRNLN